MIRISSIVSNRVRPHFPYGHYAAAWTLKRKTAPSFSSAITGEISSLSLVTKCPEPTCACEPVPPDLDIDHVQPIKGALPFYTQHVVIKTGKDDWSSRIEDDRDGYNLAKKLKNMLGAGGKYYNPARNILITNGSFSNKSSPTRHSVSVFPQGVDIDEVDLENLDPLANYLSGLDAQEHTVEGGAGLQLRHHNGPTILICGHGSRDRRCGALGPLLQRAFQAHLERLMDQPSLSADHSGIQGIEYRSPKPTIGLVSHIGGHKWAGNVILYFPPDYRSQSGSPSLLASKGVWYGRVEPKHVEGILSETVQRGNIIEELLRGVHSAAEGH